MSLDNHDVLTPTRFLDRAAAVFADRTAVVDGAVELTWSQVLDRVDRATGLLAAHGVGPGDRVALLCANSAVMLELHHAVPLRSAVMVPLNTRLSEPELRHVVRHSGARLLVATGELAPVAERLAAALELPLLVADGPGSSWEQGLAGAAPARLEVADERALLSINYTSGTTGQPKGVAYHHRGAYLQALAMAYHTRLDPGSRYLWTLPMFHCHGWSFPWAVTAAGGTHVALRTMDVEEVWRRLDEGATHLSAAPTVLVMIAEAAAAHRLPAPVHVTTGGAPPSPALLRRMSGLHLEVTHLYGLTETFGPVMVNVWQPEWDRLDDDAVATMQARQGVPNIVARPVRVVGPGGAEVPPDAATVGELVVRGNDVMLGYHDDPEATDAVSTTDGWLRTGDLAVRHADGYVAIADRLKDVIVSGGENIASVEVERVLDQHPDVVECAVVGLPDERWGEVPVAFVTARAGSSPSAEALVAFAREHLAGFKVPRRVVFTDLPRTSTGKIQKNVLRRLDAGVRPEEESHP